MNNAKELVKAAINLMIWMGALNTVIVLDLWLAIAGLIFLFHLMFKEKR